LGNVFNLDRYFTIQGNREDCPYKIVISHGKISNLVKKMSVIHNF